MSLTWTPCCRMVKCFPSLAESYTWIISFFSGRYKKCPYYSILMHFWFSLVGEGGIFFYLLHLNVQQHSTKKWPCIQVAILKVHLNIRELNIRYRQFHHVRVSCMCLVQLKGSKLGKIDLSSHQLATIAPIASHNIRLLHLKNHW